MTSPGEYWPGPLDTTLSLECADCAWRNHFLYYFTQKLLAWTKRQKFTKDASISISNSLMTVKSPETLDLIPMAFSLLEENLCSHNIHNHMSVMAEESLTKQYCTIIQYTVMWLLLLSLFWNTEHWTLITKSLCFILLSLVSLLSCLRINETKFN